MSIAIDILLGLFCLAGGVFLGFFPSRREQMTSWQERVSSAVGFVYAVIFVVLMVMRKDVETWVIVGTLLAGFLIGRIPPLARKAQDRWEMFRPHRAKDR